MIACQDDLYRFDRIEEHSRSGEAPAEVSHELLNFGAIEKHEHAFGKEEDRLIARRLEYVHPGSIGEGSCDETPTRTLVDELASEGDDLWEVELEPAGAPIVDAL